MKENETKQNKIVKSIPSVVGSVAGAGIGFFGGPAAAIAGSAIGSVITSIGQEIVGKVLSRNENRRVNTVFELVKDSITVRVEKGEKIRDDGFFENIENERSSGEEVLEGLLIATQRETEERKLPFLANLYVNLAFKKDLSREESNQLINVAENLSYRQLELLSTVAFFQMARGQFGKLNFEGKQERQTAFGQLSGYDNISLMTEVYDLHRKGLVGSSEVILDIAGINPSKLILIGLGVKMYEYMELAKIPVGSFIMIFTELLTKQD